jgi:hypothetical protein
MALSSKSGGQGPSTAKLIDDLEARMNETQRRYEQYFIGIERNEPVWFRDDLKRKIKDIKKMHFVNTGQRYKFQNLCARFTLMESYWTRILKQIEEGTYHKQLFMQKLRDKAKGVQGQKAGKNGAGDKEQADRQGEQSSANGDQDFHSLYDKYSKAQGKTGEAATPKDKFISNLENSLPNLKKKFGDRPVEFKIVIKDGKAIVRVVPK